MGGMFEFETAQVNHQAAMTLARRREPDGRRLWFAGIDPGKKGYLSIIDLTDQPQVVLCEPWPILGGKGFTYDLPAVWTLVQRLQAANVVGVALEQQQAYPKQGASSNFVLGCGYGMLQAFLTAAGVPFETVHPSTWKKAMKIRGQGGSPAERKKDGKRRSIATAQSMFPGYDLRPTAGSKKPSDGIAESLLLALYAGRHLVWVD